MNRIKEVLENKSALPQNYLIQNQLWFFVFSITFFLSLKTYAQPGGGGGLKINKVYNEQLEAIDTCNQSFRVRAFVLSDTTSNSKIIQENYPHNNRYLKNHLFLPGNYGSSAARISFPLKNQRLLIIMDKDSMIVDFHNIIPANGAGSVDVIDSLVFKPGHFIYNRGVTQSVIGFNNYNEYREIIRNGLTPYIYKKLKKYGYGTIKYIEKINVSFLAKENLPATFFLRRGANYKGKRNLNDCISDIKKAQRMGLKIKEYEQSLLLLSEIYDKKKNYDKAINAISELLEIRLDENYLINNNYLYWIKENYRDRIKLYIKKNKFKNGL